MLSLRQKFAPELAIDLGTASSLVYRVGRGVVTHEDSFVAVDERGRRYGKVVAVGTAAKDILGRTASAVQAIQPLQGGAITDLRLTQELLRHIIGRSTSITTFVRPRVVVGVPTAISEVEERAVVEAVELAGAGKVMLVDEIIAAAVGIGVPLSDEHGVCLVDIGGGTTSAAVVTRGGIVTAQTSQMAGDRFDERIGERIRRHHRVDIGKASAEKIKCTIGAALRTDMDRTMEVQGRDSTRAAPRLITVTEDDVVAALREPLLDIAKLIQGVLERTPPELAGDILEQGIYLVGGGSLLREIDTFLSQELGLPITLVEDPVSAMVLGAGKMVESLSEYAHLVRR